MKKLLLIICFIFTIFLSANASTIIVAPHWNKETISVYIPKDNKKSITMKHAFQKWENNSYDKLKFNYVEKKPADIEVEFSETAMTNDTPISGYSVTLQNNEIKNAKIDISTKNIKNYSNDYVYTVMLHSVGHALGLQDTNRKGSGIMYSPVNEKIDLTKRNIKKLYALNNWSWKDKTFGE